ncbi:Aldehyde/histidinol dehydrogenase [Phyllosticta citriasiana]|uniref:Aldehyde/histidinol dehydrogenase n=1 Tax=Phyllosticta citriasiana TaxID=595635 RepID=A0ABR1KFT7_9PEZI
MLVENGTRYTVPLLINGEEVISTTTFDVTSPASHQFLWKSSSATSAHVDSALATAAAAFPAWSKSKPAQRRTIFMKAADLLQQREDELKRYMTDETGGIDPFTGFNIFTAAELMRDVAGRSSNIMGHVPMCQDEGTGALVLKEPYGVILGIAPWNAPYILGLRAVIYAIAAGNTCILKGSELCPRAFYSIGRVLADAGLPAGVLNVIYTTRDESPAATTQLINSPAIKKINFTGSTAIGSIIASMAGKALKPCLMELGGKASSIVLDDADVELAAFQCALGAFLHGGQVCMATERILVHKDILPAFKPAFQTALAKVFPDHAPAPVLVQSPTVEKNKRLVGDAIAGGASILYGDHQKRETHPETGAFSHTRMRPIVVEGVKPEMDLYHEESFGPTVSLIEVHSEEDALVIANDTAYGLTSAVFSKDLARALRIAKRIESGAVHINTMSIHDEATLPHGGAKSSGWGRFNGQWGVDEFLRLKTITYKE